MRYFSTELRKNELFYKHYWETHPERDIQTPAEEFEFIDIMEQVSLFQKEDMQTRRKKIKTFSPFDYTDKDILSSIHDRYCPAFIHNHTFFEVSYLYSGTCKNYIEGINHTMQVGDILILNPCTKHAVQIYDDTSILINFIIRKDFIRHILLDILPKDAIITTFFKRILLENHAQPFMYFRTGTDKTVSSEILKLYEINHSGKNYAKQLSNAAFSAFLIFLLQKHEKNILKVSASELQEDTSIFILEYLQHHYADITLQEFADFFNYSPRQIERILKNTVGLNFKEIVQNLRIAKAKQLLENTGLSLERISFEAGFSSLNNFFRVFRKYTGMTPNQYRRTVRIDM